MIKLGLVTTISFCSLLIAIGGLNLLLLWRNRTLARHSRSWQTTTGQVVNAYILAGSLNSFGGIKVSYRYIVAGQRYTGNRLTFGSSWLNVSPATAQATLQRRYPLGTEVTVYYDPQSPQQSVLEPRLAGIFHSGLISVFCFFLAGLIGLATVLDRVP